MDEEYGFGSTPSTKGDVYSFGILLLEMMTRNRPTNSMFVEGLNLSKWVRMDFPDKIWEVINTRLLRDENIDAHEILNCVNQLVLLGLVCTRESPEERPTMIEVVAILERIKKTFVGITGVSKLPSDLSSLPDVIPYMVGKILYPKF